MIPEPVHTIRGAKGGHRVLPIFGSICAPKLPHKAAIAPESKILTRSNKRADGSNPISAIGAGGHAIGYAARETRSRMAVVTRNSWHDVAHRPLGQSSRM